MNDFALGLGLERTLRAIRKQAINMLKYKFLQSLIKLLGGGPDPP